MIGDAERARSSVVGKLDLPAFERLAVVVSQNGQQHLSLKVRARGRPIDVEVVGKGRRRAVLQNVEPPRVIGTDAHVVGHDVGNMAHAMALQCRDEVRVVFLAADLGVERLVVHGNVVAVRAALPRAQIRRAVDVAYAELGQIRDKRGSIPEPELAVQLQPIRCPGHVHNFAAFVLCARQRCGRADGPRFMAAAKSTKRASLTMRSTDSGSLRRQLGY